MFKVCTKCGKKKPLTEFYRRRDRDCHRPDCKECNKSKVKSRFMGDRRETSLKLRRSSSRSRLAVLKQTDPAKLKEQRRREALRRSLKERGIDIATFEQLLTAQNGQCAICKVPANELRRRLCIDHDHVTGAVRGLLCGNCNRALGYFNDNPERLQNATRYLNASPAAQ